MGWIMVDHGGSMQEMDLPSVIPWTFHLRHRMPAIWSGIGLGEDSAVSAQDVSTLWIYSV